MDGRGRTDLLSVSIQEEKVDPGGLLRTAVERFVAERERFETSIQ